MGKRLLMVLSSLALMLGLTTTRVSAAGGTLSIAQYVSIINDSSTYDPITDTVTYTGTWHADIPIGAVMQPYETQMATLGGTGAYPHGLDGRNHIAYIRYNVNFPSGVTVGAVSTSSASAMFPASGISSTVSGNSVGLKFKLADVNWATTYTNYNNDKAAGFASRNITVDIPYSYTVDCDNASTLSNVTSSGDFTFYLSSFDAIFGTNPNVYSSDTASMNAFPNIVDACPANNTITANLDGDIATNGDTQNTSVYTIASPTQTVPTDVVPLSGTLNFKTVKDQLVSIKNTFGPSFPATNILLNNISSGFKATLNLPAGVEFASPLSATLIGGNGIFAVSGTPVVSGNTVEVNLALVNPGQYTNYDLLSNALNTVADTLQVDFSGVQFSSTATPSTNYTITGGFNGNFSAIASVGGFNQKFNLVWNAVQSASGLDATAPAGSQGISFTMNYTVPPTPITRNETLLGDIRIGDNTEHDAVFIARRESNLTVTGVLDITPVKNELADIESTTLNAALASQVHIGSDYDFQMKAVLTLPQGMKYQNPTVNLTGDNGSFRIVSTSNDDHRMEVILSTDHAPSTYEDLRNMLMIANNELNVNISGVVFTSDSQVNTNYTITGEISGYMNASATIVPTMPDLLFSLTWDVIQNPASSDFINPTSTDITYTLKYLPVEATLKTSDSSNIAMYIGMIALSLAGLFFTLYKRTTAEVK